MDKDGLQKLEKLERRLELNEHQTGVNKEEIRILMDWYNRKSAVDDFKQAYGLGVNNEKNDKKGKEGINWNMIMKNMLIILGSALAIISALIYLLQTILESAL